MSKKRIVVVGGGTGTHTVLRGLRTQADSLEITAIVSMADSGGSTGRLRDEFGQLPAGDVRNALTSMMRFCVSYFCIVSLVVKVFPDTTLVTYF